MNKGTLINTYSRDGIEIDWFSFGTGSKSFIMIPGLSLKSVMSSAQAIMNAYSAFSKEYTVYVIDKRKNAPEGYSVSDMASDTVKLLENIGIKRGYFFGTSLGGMIVQQIAVDRPEITEKIIIASSMARASESCKKIIGAWAELAKEQDVVGLNRSIVRGIYSKSFYERFSGVFAMFENSGTPYECAQLYTFSRACVDFDIYDSLEKIKCPVLVIGAWGDEVLGGQASVDIADKTGCELYMYGNEFGHAVYDEADDYKEKIAKFFSDGTIHEKNV